MEQSARMTLSVDMVRVPEQRTAAEDVLGALYDVHGRALFYYALALTGSREDAEDAVQEVFAGLARQTGKLLRIDNPQGYLVKATRNAAYSILRSRQRRGNLEQALIREQHTALCSSSGEGQADLFGPNGESLEDSTLRECFARLPLEQREVLALKVLQGMTFREIGKAVGISINTAASRYRYGIEKLRASLGKDQ